MQNFHTRILRFNAVCSFVQFIQLTELRSQLRHQLWCLLLQSPHSPIFAIFTLLGWDEMTPWCQMQWSLSWYSLALGLSRLSWVSIPTPREIHRMSQILGDNSWFVMNISILQREPSPFISSLASGCLMSLLCSPAVSLSPSLHLTTRFSTNVCLSLSFPGVCNISWFFFSTQQIVKQVFNQAVGLNKRIDETCCKYLRHFII